MASKADGRPDFGFDLIRRTDRSAAIYGRLSFRIAPDFPAAAAAASFRAAHAGASIHPITFSGGFLRLIATAPVGLPAGMLDPRPLFWSDLGDARFDLLLEEEAARLTAAFLEGSTFSLLAYAELEHAVHPAPLPLTAEFDPAELSAALVAALSAPDEDRSVGTDDLAAHLRDRLGSLPIRWRGDPRSHPAGQVAATLAALVRRWLGTPVPAPQPDGQARLRLPAAAAGRMVWDLMQPQESRETLCVSLNSFGALHALAGATRVRRVTVPQMALGRWTVAVNADLPMSGAAVLGAELGVVLSAPPHPPQRPAVAATPLIQLPAPAYAADVTLRLSPAESSPVYTVTTYARFPDGLVTDGVPKPCPADPARLILEAGDFPAAFVTVELDDFLHREAIVTGAVVWGAATQETGAAGRCAFALDDSPATTLCLPREAAGGMLELDAVRRDGSGRRVALSLPARSVRLDPSALPGYGHHRQAVRCLFPPGFSGAVLLEVAGEESGAVTTLRLGPAEPQAEFGWFAASAFAAGYRFRRRGGATWSPSRPPSAPLQLTVDPATGAVAVDPEENT